MRLPRSGTAPKRPSQVAGSHVASYGGYVMRHAEFAPFYRSAIGFDRLFQALDRSMSFDTESTYPPYNIERTGENAYRISLAVAGFTPEELKIEVKDQPLFVAGEKGAEPEGKSYLR